MAANRRPRAQPVWTEIKGRLSTFDKVGLVDVIADLYRASAENRAFLHARFGLGADPLGPYKATISRWAHPDWKQEHSVAKAKKAISDYRKAVAAPEGLAELTTYYCEEASAYATGVGMDEAGFYDALVRMYEQAIKQVVNLQPPARAAFGQRLEIVRVRCLDIGWGVADAIDTLLSESGLAWSDDMISDQSDDGTSK